MVVDTSALIAILFEEADASAYSQAILNDVTRFLSAATLLEASMVSMGWSKPAADTHLDVLIRKLQLVIVPVDHEQVLIAREAFRRFGKGRNRAGLNFGDCFSYALAKVKGEPLLYKGKDFSQTDIVPA